jgi:PHP family Zn ribbon phosphoesterase
MASSRVEPSFEHLDGSFLYSKLDSIRSIYGSNSIDSIDLQLELDSVRTRYFRASKSVIRSRLETFESNSSRVRVEFELLGFISSEITSRI